jgi:putative endonuclease
VPSPTQLLGARGEAEAEAFLAALGYRTLDRHYTCRFGELDLVLSDGRGLVFVEVRLRRGHRFGSPEESITKKKLERLAAAIETYRNEHEELAALPYQLDLLVIDETTGQSIRHLPNITLDE